MIKIVEFLSGLKMAIVGGVFLACSLVLMLTGTEIPFDPAWVTVAVCGIPLFYWAVWCIAHNDGVSKITTSLLVSLAVIASIMLELAPMTGGHDEHGIFAAGEVAFIMAIGAILEEKTVAKAKKGIKNLIALVPERARRIVDGREEMVPIEAVGLGDVLRVLPGETVPADGEIVSGATSVDQSIMTGESLPVDKEAGDGVYCGTINRFGAIDVRVSRASEDSSLQKLIRMVKDAEENKAPMQRIVDKWASALVPIALAIAVITFLVTQDAIRAVTILVVFCPCALALATPTAIVAAIGQATKYGVIIKSGDALERMGKADLIAFDKTGTLTYGRLAVSDVISFDGALPERELLALLAAAEAYSEHPLGKAVVAYAVEQGIDIRPAEDFQMIPGKGISAAVGERKIRCGSAAWLYENGVSTDAGAEGEISRLRGQGKAMILVAQDGKCIGLAALSDTLREASKAMVEELRAEHTDAVLLTGDHRQTADYFARQVGITDVRAELLPAQKVEMIRELQAQGRRICMIGDGVNDAPALKTAYVGLAMGGIGSDIAVDAADLVLMSDDIARVPYLKRLSAATVRLIKLNITLSMTLNFAAIVLSILAVLNPVTGALWHNAGSVLVVLNAARLYDRKFYSRSAQSGKLNKN